MNHVHRFLVSHRRGPQFHGKLDAELAKWQDAKRKVAEIRKTSAGRRVVEMADEDHRQIEAMDQDLWIDPDMPLEDPSESLLPIAPEGSFSKTFRVTDLAGTPVSHAQALALGRQVAYRGVGNSDGNVRLSASEKDLRRVVVSAPHGSWSKLIEAVDASDQTPMEVKLRPLLAHGAHDWGHRLMGFRSLHSTWTGKGVRVAIVDSGADGSHSALRLAGGAAFVDEGRPEGWDVDPRGCGTHLAGILNARDRVLGTLGGAPEAQIYALKVMPGGRMSHLVEAVEWSIRHKMDLICFGACTREPSRILHGIIREAYQHGIACLAGSGDFGSHAAFPAAFPETIGVSALGQLGSFPTDSGHQLHVSRFQDPSGQFFAANFSCFAEGVDFCAPGVAILSTVPKGLGVRDGTSRAAALVTAMAAVALQSVPGLRTGGPQQVENLKTLLQHSAQNLGLPKSLQGAGLPVFQQPG